MIISKMDFPVKQLKLHKKEVLDLFLASFVENSYIKK